jgi:hypothetical protein
VLQHLINAHKIWLFQNLRNNIFVIFFLFILEIEIEGRAVCIESIAILECLQQDLLITALEVLIQLLLGGAWANYAMLLFSNALEAVLIAYNASGHFLLVRTFCISVRGISVLLDFRCGVFLYWLD